MTITLESPLASETELEKERNRFSELSGRLVNALINQVFDLQPRRAVQRMQYLIFLFLLSGFLITLTHREYSLRIWAEQLRNLFQYLLNPAFAQTFPNTLFDFFNFVILAFTDPRSVQYIPIFLAAFFIAFQCAAIYLADIFELESDIDIPDGIKVAREFIWEVALTGSDETIRIQQGDISDAHRHSSNYLIGGPGKVIVDLDSVALFEKPDGTPHVIGPTGKEPGGKATLDGFERFRQAIDIRDHYVDLRDQDSRSQSVKGRSLDGLPITATDVRLMFSVHRGENPKKTDQDKFPYPFSPEAIKNIVYKSSSEVTPDQLNPSAYRFGWVNNMVGSIRGQLGKFISERKLSDFLASIGMPEFEKAQQTEASIAEQMRQLTQETDDLGKTEIKLPPEFTPRYKIKNLFSEFAEEFTKSTRDKGVELHWIGIGTWKTPPGLNMVPEKHLEAWKQSQENLKNGSDEAMKKAEKEAMLQRFEALIRSVPLESYEELTGSGSQSGMYSKRDHKRKDSTRKGETHSGADDKESDGEVEDMLSSLMILRSLRDRKSHSSSSQEYDHNDAMRQLVIEYRKQLLEAVEFMKAKNEAVPPVIEEAIKHLDVQLGLKHWIGR